MGKGKIATTLVIISTVILAGVAIFTASKLYQLRQESISPLSPESQPLAWDCSKYVFSLSSSGVVTVSNQSTRDEPAQQAKVYINDTLVATLAVPALPRGQSSSIGTVQVPSGGFTWKVEGSRDCRNSGTSAAACTALTFALTENSPTPTLIITSTVTPTSGSTGTLTPTSQNTSTPTSIASATVSPTNPPGSTATPTFPPPPSIPEPPQCTAQKPSAPILTSVTKNGTEAILKWTSVSSATHYVISYGTSTTNLQYGVPNTGNVTTYTIGSLGANTTYYFTVYAVNDCMPSDGSTIVSSVAGASTASSEQLPATGISIPTVFGISAGILIIAAALLLAI